MIPVGIVGFRGYSGAELVHILSRHPHVEPILLEHRDAENRPQPLGQTGPRRLKYTCDEVRAAGIAAVFLATPPEVSMELTPPVLDAGIKVIDLSGAFRLRHSRKLPALVQRAAHAARTARRGRLRTAGVLPRADPRRAAGLQSRLLSYRRQPRDPASDRSRGDRPRSRHRLRRQERRQRRGPQASLTTSFCEVAENFSAYSILEHRHVPEVLHISGLEEAEFSFTAQLLPLDRGILETIYFRASEGIAAAEDLLAIYQKRYAGEPFVRLYPTARFPTCKPWRAPTSAISGSSSMPAPAAPWWFPPSTIW